MVEQVKYRPYDLRHFFALMLLLERKVNLKKIQMGYSACRRSPRFPVRCCTAG
ncbi:site-specific integrase [Microvirga lotononidis]|uniref:Uncharacterized protein n=1 Tax=Microvirga lotononidis TaxID=864069 RepID=I4Z495_9HYPH|nr:hypothetical protein [Microvirga lotononidis]EIM31037.1 hypothetical protein MicloDRAFT_00000240 [Microvirga lotononidis]WQO30112.1 hypothetical protein U0023_27535 [Microvirga lotononidis]